MQHSFRTFRERGRTGQDGGEAEVPLSVPPPPPTQLLQSKRCTGEEEPQKFSHTLIQFSTSNLEKVLPAACGALKLTQEIQRADSEDGVPTAASIDRFQPPHFRGGQLGHRSEPVPFLISSQLDNSTVRGNNFDTWVIYLTSAIRVIS